MDKKIVGRECKFVVHIPAVENVNDDTHYIKEVIHYDDGTTKPNIKLITNFKRPFWITKPHFQNYKNKKESESLDRLNEYTSTQSDLGKNIASRLGGMYIGKKNLKDVVDSPYVYGADIDSKTIIKKMYMDKYPNAISPYRVCTLDIEYDIIREEIIIISIAMLDKIYTVINKNILKNINNVEEELKYLWDKYIPKTNITTNMTVEYKILNNELELVLYTLNKVHSWLPDFLAVWNISYDMNIILNVLNKNKISPKDVMSDPNIPKELRYFKWVEGNDNKVTASGKFRPLNTEETWNYVICPSSFYWIDAMSAYRFIRVGDKTIPGGYSLDNVLKYELGDSYKKLKFEDDDNTIFIGGIQWHKYMVANKPLHYIIYNQWDVISMLHLDEKTTDLKYVLPMLANVSSFDIFNSGPKRIVSELFFFYLDRGMVLGTKPKTIENDTILGLNDWIVMLPSQRIKHNGAKIISNHPNLNTNIRFYTFDADQVSGYPSNTQAANVSSDTTLKEIIDIEGIDKEVFKLQNINIMFGNVNALEYCRIMLGLPSLEELDEIISKDI